MLPQNDAPRLHQSEMDSSHNNLRDLLQRMERRIDAAFTEFSHKLTDIETRVSAIEQRPSNPLSSPSTPSSSSSGRRRTPPELQVPYFIAEAPTCFDSYNQPRLGGGRLFEHAALNHGSAHLSQLAPCCTVAV